MKKKDILILIVFGIIFIYLLYEKRENSETLLKVGKFTVGEITDIKPMKGGLIYHYKFNVFGIKSESEMRSGRNKKIGDKCFVIFNPENVNENKMLLNLPKVPDSLKKHPRNGWEKLPIKTEKSEIIKAINGG